MITRTVRGVRKRQSNSAALRIFSTTVLVLFAISTRADAQPLPPMRITLDEALERFRSHGFDLLIADAAVAGARADI